MKALRRSLISISLVVLAVFVLANPHVAGAQTDAELQTTIRAALLQDPRTAQMSEAELDAMVQALSAQAAKQGISSSDIRWAPGQSDMSAETATNNCGSMPYFFCVLNNSFGFDGSDMKIPIGLGITSGLLIVLLGLALERHHMHVKAAKAAITKRPEMSLYQ